MKDAPHGSAPIAPMASLAALVAAVWLLAGCASAIPASASSPVLSRIQGKGELVVGTAASMPPLNMTTKTGEVIGLDTDYGVAFAKSQLEKVTHLLLFELVRSAARVVSALRNGIAGQGAGR